MYRLLVGFNLWLQRSFPAAKEITKIYTSGLRFKLQSRMKNSQFRAGINLRHMNLASLGRAPRHVQQVVLFFHSDSFRFKGLLIGKCQGKNQAPHQETNGVSGSCCGKPSKDFQRPKYRKVFLLIWDLYAYHQGDENKLIHFDSTGSRPKMPKLI